MIDEEIAKAKEGKEGYVGVKINSLTDKKIIDKLIEAGKSRRENPHDRAWNLLSESRCGWMRRIISESSAL